MQVKKELVKQSIVQAAKEEFMEKGFQKANLRAIAAKASCSLSNLYNYFSSKEDMFREILAPLLTDVEYILTQMREIKLSQNRLIDAYGQQLQQVEMLVEYIDTHRDLLTLFALKSTGSRIGNYHNQIIDLYTDVWYNYLEIIHRRSDIVISRFLVRNICYFHVNTVVDALKKNLSREQMNLYAREILTFTYYGFRSLLQIT